ncbi:hypothetical protein [Microbacterium elymi]|uniref:hypothetical protein n=1 Tax=Microbacterium elymi TaxID=2909587 RepID=UPI0033901922
MPAGTFDATGTTTSALLNDGMQPGDVIAVTVERAGGSPTGEPTTQADPYDPDRLRALMHLRKSPSSAR